MFKRQGNFVCKQNNTTLHIVEMSLPLTNFSSILTKIRKDNKKKSTVFVSTTKTKINTALGDHNTFSD